MSCAERFKDTNTERFIDLVSDCNKSRDKKNKT